MHWHPMELQVIICARPCRIFGLSFRNLFFARAKFSSGPRVVNPVYVKEFIKYTLSYEGVITRTNFCRKSTRIRDAMINGALSPHQVLEIPYCNRSRSRNVRDPIPVHRIVFYPIKITGERADKPEGQGRRIVRRTLCTYIVQLFYLC